MIFVGIILIGAGIASYVHGSQLNDSFVEQLRSLFTTGTTNPGTTFTTIGVVAIVVGCIFLIAGLVKKNKNDQ